MIDFGSNKIVVGLGIAGALDPSAVSELAALAGSNLPRHQLIQAGEPPGKTPPKSVVRGPQQQLMILENSWADRDKAQREKAAPEVIAAADKKFKADEEIFMKLVAMMTPEARTELVTELDGRIAFGKQLLAAVPKGSKPEELAKETIGANTAIRDAILAKYPSKK